MSFRSKTMQGNTLLLPNLVPIWLWLGFEIGTRNNDAWASPYGVIKAGYPIPATQNPLWWNHPWHLFLSGGVGVILPYSIGAEIACDYLRVSKDFTTGTKTSISSAQLSAKLSWGFQLINEKIDRHRFGRNKNLDRSLGSWPHS